eukprot:TRINITY_DN2954_c0_g2_i1.p1 TRINITY_DN2954_c0_g2~~TRINITY_DN2954_c0_g2_i1.p1  ORF type:complete len:187 (+),score=42.42 TRINITY_DN2954_c0_g2_i1:54-563(+)
MSVQVSHPTHYYARGMASETLVLCSETVSRSPSPLRVLSPQHSSDGYESMSESDCPSSDSNSQEEDHASQQQDPHGLLLPLRQAKKFVQRCRKRKEGTLPMPKIMKVRQSQGCIFCGTYKTPEWRRGPDGKRSLCNACGLRFSNLCKREKELPLRESKLEVCSIKHLIS